MNFRSYFGMPPFTADRVSQSGSTKDLRGFPVYCDTIVIDIDNAECVQPVGHRIASMGIHFAIQSSRRGLHLHIPIVPIMGTNVPNSVKMWLMSWFEPEEVDVSMLHQAGQIRLQGAVHEKDGSIKTLLEVRQGTLLQIPQVDPPKHQLRYALRGSDGYSEDGCNQRYTQYRFEGQGAGNRYPHLYKIVMAGVGAKILPSAILKNCLNWNKGNHPMHRESYIIETVARLLRGIR